MHGFNQYFLLFTPVLTRTSAFIRIHVSSKLVLFSISTIGAQVWMYVFMSSIWLESKWLLLRTLPLGNGHLWSGCYEHASLIEFQYSIGINFDYFNYGILPECKWCFISEYIVCFLLFAWIWSCFPIIISAFIYTAKGKNWENLI